MACRHYQRCQVSSAIFGNCCSCNPYKIPEAEKKRCATITVIGGNNEKIQGA